MDSLLIVLRRLARICLKTAEGFIGLVILVLLVALVRQMLTMTYLVMGHDTDAWLEVARKTGAGLLPYRDFDFEYPPLGFLAIVLPFVLWIPGVTSTFSQMASLPSHCATPCWSDCSFGLSVLVRGSQRLAGGRVRSEICALCAGNRALQLLPKDESVSRCLIGTLGSYA